MYYYLYFRTSLKFHEYWNSETTLWNTKSHVICNISKSLKNLSRKMRFRLSLLLLDMLKLQCYKLRCICGWTYSYCEHFIVNDSSKTALWLFNTRIWYISMFWILLLIHLKRIFEVENTPFELNQLKCFKFFLK